MFDIGASELLMIAIVAIVVIGPKDMPMALRAAGRWIGKMRRMSNHFRAGVDAIIREAEMEEMRKEWEERNKAIMARYPDAAMPEGGALGEYPPAVSDTPMTELPPPAETGTAGSDQPALPLAPPPGDR